MNTANTQNSDAPLTRLQNTGIAYVEFAVSNPVHYRIMFGNEILENDRTSELVKAAEVSFNELLHAVKVCQDEKIVKSLNPYIIANTLWSMAHGLSTLLIDGQIQAVNVFKEGPALLQPDTDTGRADVQQIFEYMEEVIFTGLKV